MGGTSELLRQKRKEISTGLSGLCKKSTSKIANGNNQLFSKVEGERKDDIQVSVWKGRNCLRQ